MLDALQETQFAMNKAGIGIVRLDPKTGCFVWVNEYVTNRLGYSLEELRRIPVGDIALELRTARARQIVHVERRHGKVRFETDAFAKDGTRIPVEVISYRLQIGSVSAPRIIAFVTDITERKQAEAEQLALYAEMEQLDHLQVARQTVSALAHELNQPLNAIASFSGAALRLMKSGEAAPQKLLKALEGCSVQSQRAGNVVRELLAFLHHDRIATEALYLNNLIRRALDLVRVNTAQKFEPELDLEPELPQVMVNRVQIEKVLVNLITNAVEAMLTTPGTKKIRIQVATFSEPGIAKVTISDAGPGILPELMNRIFDPFFTTKAKGIGMGLAISRAIIEAHGGQLWVESTPGAGTHFHFTVPFAP
jgi:PAS domain S-box-containing protein